MAQVHYMAGDPRLVDQLVCELKSRGIFDQFRKECIADVDTRPAYQNLRQRVENSVTTFLARQSWKPDLNKNQLREKLRKHILDGNYLEQGVERIVDQVVNPKVASVFIPQVEDLVYNYLGVTRKKTSAAEISNDKINTDILPVDLLEAVSPCSVKSNEEKDVTEIEKLPEETKMDVDEEPNLNRDIPEDTGVTAKIDGLDTQLSGTSDFTSKDSDNVFIDQGSIPLPEKEINLENIPAPEYSPPKPEVELEKIALPRDPDLSTEIPLPEEMPKNEKERPYLKTLLNSEDDESSSGSSLRRNMSPLTPVRNFDNENSCDAQQGFDNDSNGKKRKNEIEQSTFAFALENKLPDTNFDDIKVPEGEQKTSESSLSYQFHNKFNINNFTNTTLDDSSDSNILQIDYESDVNSKMNYLGSKTIEESNTQNLDMSASITKDKLGERKSSHKSSHKSRDSQKHTCRDRKYDIKHFKEIKEPKDSTKSSKDERKSSKEDYNKSKSAYKDKSKEDVEKKLSKEKESSKCHKSHKDSNKDTKYKNSSIGHKHSSSSSKHIEDKKSSSSHKDKYEKDRDHKTLDKEKHHKNLVKEKTSDRSSRDKSKNIKNHHRSEREIKSNAKNKDKDRKDKKDVDDHYSASGRGKYSRRSTDRDSNDGSSSSKGSHNQSNSKSSQGTRENKSSSSKSENNSTSSNTTSPSDGNVVVNERSINEPNIVNPTKPVFRVETQLESHSPSLLAFVPDISIKKPKIAANFEEAKKFMKMRKFLDEEQRRMNQEAALLLEFHANVRPSLSQVYSSASGPELEFACVDNKSKGVMVVAESNTKEPLVVETSNLPLGTQNKKVSQNIAKELGQKVYFDNEEKIIEDDAAIETISDINSYIEATREKIEKYSEPIREISESNISQVTEKQVKETDNSEHGQVTILGNLSHVNKQHSIYSHINKTTCKPNETNQNEDSGEETLEYFDENEKCIAEIERQRFSAFLKKSLVHVKGTKKMYLINCDTFEEKVMKEVCEKQGGYEVINYHKNGHTKFNSKISKSNIEPINVASEVMLKEKLYQLDDYEDPYSNSLFSPISSDYSFEYSSEYNVKLEEMVNNTSRQQVMEIILGVMPDESPHRMPKIGYFTESSIENVMTTVNSKDTSLNYNENILKRKLDEINLDNNNETHLIKPKLRKQSESDQISSTTQDSEYQSNFKGEVTISRSKYLGKARRVGLSRPKKLTLPNSPSSDKSIENYEHNSTTTLPKPNGKLKTPRMKIQRYDESDLYKPKLNHLSRRNTINNN